MRHRANHGVLHQRGMPTAFRACAIFAHTTAAYDDRSRGIIGNNGSVLTVRATGAVGVTLQNAQGREGLVASDTLRDSTSGRIRPQLWRRPDDRRHAGADQHRAHPGNAGGRATWSPPTGRSGGRSRRAGRSAIRGPSGKRMCGATWRATSPASPGCQGRWISWSGRIGCGAAPCAPCRRGCSPPSSARRRRLAKTTLKQTWQRRRVVAHVAAITERLGSQVHEHGAVLEALGRFAPAVREVAKYALVLMQPVL